MPRIHSATDTYEFLPRSYDSASTSDSPPPSPRHRLRRKRSPSPTSYSHKASRADDISRILDPSYSPSKPHSPCPTVYVDHNGNLHDPDYRHFPPVRVYEPDVHGDEEQLEEYGFRSYGEDRARRRSAERAYPSWFPAYTYEEPALIEDDEAPLHNPEKPLEERVVEDDIDDEQSAEWTPSCTHTLRRQWQAFALRLRFGLFRTKRRIRRRVGLI